MVDSPALPSLAGPLCGDLEAVRVHGGHDVDARVVEQPPDVVVGLVVVHQVQDQVQHQLSAHRWARSPSSVHLGIILQGDTSDCSQGLVDIKRNVEF